MRILEYAWKNISRNAFLSFSTTLVVALMVFFINILIFQTYTAERIIERVNESLAISIYLKSGLSSEHERVTDLRSEIRNTFPRIRQEYISSTQALDKIKERDPRLAELVETGSENPLPNSIRIMKLGIDGHKKLDSIVSNYKDIIEYDKTDLNNQMVSYRDQVEKIEPTTNLLRSIEYGMYGMIFLFCLTVFIILYNVIGNFIFFYRDEMKIIMLVGGSPIFIYGPFAIQSGLYGLIGSLLAFIGTVLLFGFVNFQEYTEFVRAFLEEFLPYFSLEIAIFLILGLLSGFLASRKYIRIIRESVHDA